MMPLIFSYRKTIYRVQGENNSNEAKRKYYRRRNCCINHSVLFMPQMIRGHPCRTFQDSNRSERKQTCKDSKPYLKIRPRLFCKSGSLLCCSRLPCVSFDISKITHLQHNFQIYFSVSGKLFSERNNYLFLRLNVNRFPWFSVHSC